MCEATNDVRDLLAGATRITTLEKIPDNALVFLEFPKDTELPVDMQEQIEVHMQQYIPGCRVITLVGVTLAGIYELQEGKPDLRTADDVPPPPPPPPNRL